MLNNKKIKLMTKMSAFSETKNGKEAIEASKYLAQDYIARNVLWMEICLTIAYVFIVLLTIIYRLDSLVTDISNFDFVQIGIVLLVIYLIIMAAGFVFSYKYYLKKYTSLRKYAAPYSTGLKHLKEYYKNDAAEQSDEQDIITVE